MVCLSNVGPILAWTGVLIAFVVALAIAVPIVRRALLAPRRPSAADNLSSLRSTLTDEEYEQVRAAARRRLLEEAEIRQAPSGNESPQPAPGVQPVERRAAPGRDLTGEPLPPAAP